MSGDSSGAFYPEPTGWLRLAGVAGILGGLLWPVTLITLADALRNCTSASCAIDRGSLGLMALAPVFIGLGALGLEWRARRTPGFGDLVGDLTIGTSAALFALSFISGLVGLIGPGLLLLLIGSLIFGITGYLNGARHRLASAMVAIGAGSIVLFVLLGAGSAGSGMETPSLLALVLFSIGWIWLGAHLLLGRPLPIPDRGEGRGDRR
jgi:hypothetical protein